jgi:hypothetical protein
MGLSGKLGQKQRLAMESVRRSGKGKAMKGWVRCRIFLCATAVLQPTHGSVRTQSSQSHAET